MGKALKAVSGCIVIAVGVVVIGVQVVGHQTGKKLDYSSWEKEGWFQKEEVSDAMKAGLAMLTQVCLEGAPCSLCIAMKQVESVFHYSVLLQRFTATPVPQGVPSVGGFLAGLALGFKW